MRLRAILFVAVISFTVPEPIMAQDSGHSTNNENGIQFFEGSWEEALALAVKENKPIFLDVYASWCAPCNVLKQKTFPDTEAGNYFNRNFINVTLDGEKDEGVQVARDLNVRAYPSLFVLDQSGRPLAYYPGYLKPADLIELGKAGIKQLSTK